jgi:hypothetical protein
MDDVQYLLTNAREESYLFLCDSRLRNKDVFPSPSNYEIEFSSPFKNVFSLDLIDATVPRTEYNVEEGRNTLVYVMGQPPTAAQVSQKIWPEPSSLRTVVVTPGDYTLPHLLNALNQAFLDVQALSGDVYALSIEPATNPPDISNKIRFTCGTPFTLVMNASSMRNILGFGEPVQNTALEVDGTYGAVEGWISTSSVANDLFCSLSRASGQAPSLVAPVPVTANEAVYPGRSLRQYFVAGTSGTPLSAELYVKRVNGSTVSQVQVTVLVASTGAQVASGTATWSRNFLTDVETWTCETLSATATLVAGTEYVFEVSASAGTSASHVAVMRAMANVVLPGTQRRGDVRVFINGVETPIAELDDDLCVGLEVETSQHHLVSPGLVNLTGEPYVMVRCEEIEKHMFRDRALEKYHAGLGMVKLATYGFTDQRFDFVSFPPRRFHPLGKLAKLTIKIERPDGSMYNARGVDHTMLIVLRYYSVPESTVPPQPILNPAYTPQLHRYLADTRWAEEDAEEYFWNAPPEAMEHYRYRR